MRIKRVTERWIGIGSQAPKLVLRFGTPTETLYNGIQVDSVSVPGSAGEFGILANHVPSIAQLKPGVVTVLEMDKSTKRSVENCWLVERVERLI